jgi:hypothetical protein
MSTTSAAVLTGTAGTARMFVAALAFTSAYVGFSAYGAATSDTRPEQIALSSRALPVTVPAAETAPAKTGEITVSVVADDGCARSYESRSLLVNPDPGEGMRYGWRLARWSPATKTWRTYLRGHDGFTGAERTAEWRAQITGNPGWYRVELTAGGKAVTSERFQVSC